MRGGFSTLSVSIAFNMDRYLAPLGMYVHIYRSGTGGVDFLKRVLF